MPGPTSPYALRRPMIVEHGDSFLVIGGRLMGSSEERLEAASEPLGHFSGVILEFTFHQTPWIKTFAPSTWIPEWVIRPERLKQMNGAEYSPASVVPNHWC